MDIFEVKEIDLDVVRGWVRVKNDNDAKEVVFVPDDISMIVVIS